MPRRRPLSTSRGSTQRSWSLEDSKALLGDGLEGERFKALKEFLHSASAAEVLSPDALERIWMEVDAAQAREACLLDMVRRRQAMDGRRTPQRVNGLSMGIPVTSLPASPRGMIRRPSFCRPASRSDSAHSARSPRPPPFGYSSAVRSASDISLAALAHSRAQSGSRGLSPSPSFDHFVAATPGGPQGDLGPMLPEPAGMWTLWSFQGPLLRRQDFMSEGDAWASFDNEVKVGPCMLRDPSGAEAAAWNWVASYFQQVSPATARGQGAALSLAASIALGSSISVSASPAAGAGLAGAAPPPISPLRLSQHPSLAPLAGQALQVAWPG